MSASSVPPSVIPISSRRCPVTTRSPSSIRGPSSLTRSSSRPPMSRHGSWHSEGHGPKTQRSAAESTRKRLKRYDREAVALAIATLIELDLINNSPEDPQ